MFTKTLAVIAAAALVGANAASLDVVGSTCSCAPLANTTSIRAEVSNVITPTGCTFKGVVGTSYACTFASAGAKESVSLAGLCHWYPDGYYDCIKY